MGGVSVTDKGLVHSPKGTAGLGGNNGSDRGEPLFFSLSRSLFLCVVCV